MHRATLSRSFIDHPNLSRGSQNEEFQTQDERRIGFVLSAYCRSVEFAVIASNILSFTNIRGKLYAYVALENVYNLSQIGPSYF